MPVGPNPNPRSGLEALPVSSSEVGFHGRDVDQIIRDLVEAAITMTRELMREEVKAKAHTAAEERVLAAIAGENARSQTLDMFREKLKRGELDDTVIDLELNDTSNPLQGMEIPGMPPGQGGMALDLGSLFGKGSPVALSRNA